MSLRSIGLVFVLAAVAGACSPNKPPTPPEQPGGVACTTEAKMCPDGSGVGRTGPNCEFAECPAAPAPTDGDTPPASPDAAAPPA